MNAALNSSQEQSPTVVILAGGLSHERDVSIRSGRRVAEILRSQGFTTRVMDVDGQLISKLEQDRPDLVWPLLHGSTGEDGSIRDILELLELPYLGTRPKASRVAWNKPVAKAVLSAAGVSTPKYVTLPQSLFRELGAGPVMDAIADKLGLPLVVKPATGGSALGVTLVTDKARLAQALVDCFAYGELALIEQAVSGTELAITVIDTDGTPRALPAVEIVTDGPYDFDARYNPGRTQYFAPARLSANQLEAAQRGALTAHRELGLRHISRTDMIISDDGTVWFLEVNVAPGMTETSLVPQGILAEGTTLAQAYTKLVTDVLTHSGSATEPQLDEAPALATIAEQD